MQNVEKRNWISVIVLIAAIAILSTAVFGSQVDASAMTRADIRAAADAYDVYTVYVPDDLPTIQAALNAAVAVYAVYSPLAAIDAAADLYVFTWTTIIVRDGVYTGPRNKNLDFKLMPTMLMSENGPENCIIDCEGDGRGFRFHRGETSYSVLDGFTITNGNVEDFDFNDSGGGGIRCQGDSSPLITNCIIKDNRAHNTGGGILCMGNSSPVITNCILTGNSTANGGGGGIACYDGSSPSIAGCIITGNRAFGGGGIRVQNSSATITNCTIAGNAGHQMAGGIHARYSTFTITNCTLSGNNAQEGGGMVVKAATGAITNSILWGNLTSGAYPELYLQDSVGAPPTTVTVDYCDVAGGETGVFVGSDSTLNWGPGNIDDDPLFVATGYWDRNDWIGGDYHLTGYSPCIDAGTDAGVYTDIDGDYRPSGDGFDMGSDEFYHGNTPRIGLNPTILENSCLRGEDAPSQGIAVWNSGGGTLSYSVTDNVGWLSVSPGGGTSTGEADPITVYYHTSGLGGGVYSATITVSDPEASNDPQYVDVVLVVDASDLTSINLTFPPNEALLTSAPTFSWEIDGGFDNIYAVDFALSPRWRIFSTWENLHLRITDTSWAMSGSLWNQIPHGSYVYWRVRGADLSISPPTVVFSGEVWWFYKP